MNHKLFKRALHSQANGTRKLMLAGLLSALSAPVMATQPDFQLPFPCGQKWQLNSYDASHAPALDMVKEPNQAGTNGAKLVAAAAGTVNQSYMSAPSGAGNIIQINHGGGWYTTYIHLKKRSVKVGDKIKQGQQIGEVGKTGATSNGHPHLHYEMGFDMNSDGVADWGVVTNERKPPVFDGKTYGNRTGQNYRNVVSKNSCNGTVPDEPKKYWIDTYAKAAGYGNSDCLKNKNEARCKVKGHLNAGTHYVFCKKKGDKATDGANFNTWWLKTDLDSYTTGSSGPSYVSALYLKNWGNDIAKDNDGTVIPNCK